jgi:2-Cys peroxiredoxin 5
MFQIRFLADPDCKFTKALDLDFDATPILGNHRSKRYALVIEDGKVKEAHVEPDNTGMSGKFSSILSRSISLIS